MCLPQGSTLRSSLRGSGRRYCGVCSRRPRRDFHVLGASKSSITFAVTGWNGGVGWCVVLQQTAQPSDGCQAPGDGSSEYFGIYSLSSWWFWFAGCREVAGSFKHDFGSKHAYVPQSKCPSILHARSLNVCYSRYARTRFGPYFDLNESS